jgi:gamma-glutamyl hydrolase
VLTQPIDEGMKQKQPKLQNKTSYIMASYINALSSAGARTVPLIFDSPNTQIELDKIDKLNGVFYCGGDGGNEYLDFGRKVYQKVKDINDQGNHLPAWGTCLGF